METFEGEHKEEEPKQRSKLLIVICWLSIMNGVFALFSHVLAVSEEPEVTMDDTIALQLETFGDLSSEIEGYFNAFLEYFTSYNLTLAVLYIMGLIGVFEMSRLRKRGFFMYGVAHLGISFFPIMIVLYNDYSLILTTQYIIFTMLFLVLYGTQLKYMD